jgi:type I restriction enzyme R subunit
MEANQAATDLLLRGTVVEGLRGGRDQTVHFIDFEHPDRNNFLIVNQFRVDPPGVIGNRGFIVPDVVLFVNGIPLVVIECKSPAATEPMEEGIDQLLRYSNQRDWIEETEGAERLFHTNQFMISTWFYEARVGTVGASFEHYLEWKDTSPVPMADVAAEMGCEQLHSQEILVAGMLRPAHLLDIVRNFTLFKQDAGRTIKVVARYQQFRAVHEAIRRLAHGQTRTQHGDSDQRGGIIWHTQGSGKSLTMVFLVRKMRTLHDLRRFKVVVVTDRTDLEKQLSDTAVLTGETVRKATGTDNLQDILAEPGADLVFAMIQKYQNRDEDTEPDEEMELFPVLNESEDILVLVDEAHRSHSSHLHANLLRALPNCAKIGFTGTPIIMGARKRTHEIFGPFIDSYTLQQSEADGSTVPIIYEGRTARGVVDQGGSLDRLFEDMFADRTPEEMEAIKTRYATQGNVLEAKRLIAAKADDMLRHYVAAVMPNNFKAMLVAVSRRAAIRYQAALAAARDSLVVELNALDPALLSLSPDKLEVSSPDIQFLVAAHSHLDTIRRLEFAAVISGGHNDDPTWRHWSERGQVDAHIERFKKPLVHTDPTKQDGLAFLCVKSMLLTGFDVPLAQVLYLDRAMRGHELLQAVARVNRTNPGKSRGLVVDYFGIAHHLKEALDAYSDADIQGALISLKDELPVLADRHQRAVAVFENRGLVVANIDACVDLLRDMRIRADFVVKLKRFLESMDIVMPRPEALPYYADAKRLGFISKAAANLYRDSQLNISGLGHKVRRLIDTHVMASGIDPTIPPVSIMDAEFESVVEGHVSPRTKASEMEHAARYHISQHFREDPAYYRKLSERLEAILREFEGRWVELVEALRPLIQDIRRGRPKDETGLDPKTQAPFLGILREEFEADLDREQLTHLAVLTVEMVEHIRQEIRVIDFWRNTYAQTTLRGWIVCFLDDHDAVPFERQQAVADRLVELAKVKHVELTT